MYHHDDGGGGLRVSGRCRGRTDEDQQDQEDQGHPAGELLRHGSIFYHTPGPSPERMVSYP